MVVKVRVLTTFFFIYEIYLGCVIKILINGYDLHEEVHLQSRKDCS